MNLLPLLAVQRTRGFLPMPREFGGIYGTKTSSGFGIPMRGSSTLLRPTDDFR